MSQISIEQIFRQSLSAVRHGWATYLGLGALLTAPSTMLQLLVPEQVILQFSAVWWANTLVGLAVTPMLAASMVAATGELLRGRPASLGGALGVAVRRWPASLALYLIAAVGIAIGTVLCVIPGFVVAAFVFVSFPVLIVEGQGVLESLFGRGWRLLEGNRIPILVLVFLLVILFLFFMAGSVGLVMINFNFEEMAESAQLLNPWYVLGNWLLGLVFMPVVWLLSTSTYFELIRVRGELPGDLVAQTAAVFD